MIQKKALVENSDTLIDLLTAECADLEKLLSLAQAEFAAASQGDFEKIFEIVSEREVLGERLEIYNKQIADLRERLGETAEVIFRNDLTTRLAVLVNEILQQDANTRPLLEAAKHESVQENNRVEGLQRRANAYSQETLKGMAYSKNL